jgi:RNA ligase
MAKFEHSDLLKEMVTGRFINVQKHPDFPLWLYNYSMRAQSHNVWNETICACRGLIMDESQNIISRPFKKFFNYWQIEPADMPNESFVVTDKMDGSLGISYWHNGVWRIATRGSFDGKQATRATQILHRKYADCCLKMQPQYTYLFEIIYPANRIIVDYGDREELVLLAVIDTETGSELTDLTDIGFPLLKTFDGFNSFEEVLQLNDNRAEGVVVRFESGLRVKVKFSEYLRLHRIMLGLSETKIWRYLVNELGIEKLCERAGEEYSPWIRATAERFTLSYNTLYQNIMDEYNALPDFSSQKEADEYIKNSPNEALLFCLLHEKPINKLVWQRIKPDENASWFSNRG